MPSTAAIDPARVKGVLLDLDNTLYDAKRAYADGLERLGLSETHAEYLRARERAKKLAGPKSPSRFNRVLYFKSYLELRDEFSPARLLDLITRYERGVLESIRKQERNLKRKKLLTELSRRYSVCVVTNEVCRMQVLKLLAIDGRNAAGIKLVTSEEVGCDKPDLKVFRVALSQTPGLRTKQCLMVGDDHNADIKPALKLGMQAAFSTEFSSEKKLRSPVGAFHLQRLSDLREVLLG